MNRLKYPTLLLALFSIYTANAANAAMHETMGGDPEQAMPMKGSDMPHGQQHKTMMDQAMQQKATLQTEVEQATTQANMAKEKANMAKEKVKMDAAKIKHEAKMAEHMSEQKNPASSGKVEAPGQRLQKEEIKAKAQEQKKAKSRKWWKFWKSSEVEEQVEEQAEE
jgi:hypothetical protein